MKLFTIGPVEMYPTTAAVRTHGFPHFRTDEFSRIMLDNSAKLADLLDTDVPDSILYFAMSGTGAMEATVQNCLSSSDKVLVINGGSFGHRFCELAAWHQIPFDSVDLKWNEQLTAAHLQPHEDKKYTAMLVNLHETSTGQLYDINLLSEFCRRKGMLLIVDAISTFLADDYSIGKYGADVTIISSQKGLCCSPGMSMVALSARMIERIKQLPKPGTYYFDFKDYLVNIPRGQTPFTPPVCVAFEIQDMLKNIEAAGGKSAWLAAIREKGAYFRRRARETGLKIVDYPISNMLTPVLFEDVDAYEVIQCLKNDYRLYVNPCGGELATRLLRVSHIGNTTLSDIDELLEKLLFSVKKVSKGDVK